MKKTFKATQVILIIAFLIATSSSSAKRYPGKTGGNNDAGITYVVIVTHPGNVELCYTYVVSVKDENGNPVGPSIIYQEGIDNYFFHESGPVSGTRIAYLERINGSGEFWCQHVLYADPDVKTGYFENGSLYIFNLIPSLIKPMKVEKNSAE